MLLTRVLLPTSCLHQHRACELKCAVVIKCLETSCWDRDLLFTVCLGFSYASLLVTSLPYLDICYYWLSLTGLLVIVWMLFYFMQ